MKFNNVSDLPSSVSHLTFVQKAQVLKMSNGLIDSGLSPDKAVEKALEGVTVLSDVKKSGTVIDLTVPAEEMISYEVIYEPDARDAHGEWMSAQTIVKAKASYDAALLAGLVKENLFHMVETDSFTIEKTWIQEEFDVVVIGSEQIIKAGTWVAKVKYHDPALWELKKANVVGGLSIQCSGIPNEETGELTEINFGIEFEEESDD